MNEASDSAFTVNIQFVYPVHQHKPSLLWKLINFVFPIKRRAELMPAFYLPGLCRFGYHQKVED